MALPSFWMHNAWPEKGNGRCDVMCGEKGHLQPHLKGVAVDYCCIDCIMYLLPIDNNSAINDTKAGDNGVKVVIVFDSNLSGEMKKTLDASSALV
jgi:hypothetical protein